ncbi:MAG: NUDIX domain-containing protein [Candidatus Iainarchaeum archaeon]|uniref:NUDIX domain-containing protein n=1 Tax=Candidatus Iainarchaeum sp. TaxID=3101447 RepID=A0A7T9DJY2_9ARCH|nr:MAG: NUDIX domain-containing protein [Candidatus Diapherotrites archaeon]
MNTLKNKLGPSEPNRPRVGVGVLICRDGKVLLGKRLAAHGKGTWSPPGGKMEFGESPLDCAKREILEETNLHLTHMRIGPYTNDVFVSDNLHYITLCVIAEATGEPKAMEPEKCAEWKWFAWNELPSPLFLPLENLKKQGFDPFESL